MKFDPTQPWTGMVPLASVARNPEQPRKFFDEVELELLGNSMKRRQEVACVVIPWPEGLKKPAAGVEWMLVDGERRWRAAKSIKLPKLWVAYKPGVAEADLHGASLTANFCRAGHTKMETARALQREIDAGKTPEEVAASVGKSNAWASNYLALLDLHPDLQALLDPPTPKEGRLPMNVGIQLAQHPQDRQLRLWRKVRGMRQDAAANVVRLACPASNGRRAGHDERYLATKVKSILSHAAALQEVGTTMINRVRPEKAAEMASDLSRARAILIEFQRALESREDEP